MILSKKEYFPPEMVNPQGENLQEILGLVAGGAKSHSLARVTLPAGHSSAPHYHKGSEESYWILSGTAIMNIDGKSIELMPGEAVLIEPMEVHQISNQNDDELVFLAVCVPAWHPEDSFDVD